MMSGSRNNTNHRGLLAGLSLVLSLALAVLVGLSGSGRAFMAASTAETIVTAMPISAANDPDRAGDDQLAYDAASDEALWDAYTILPDGAGPPIRATVPIRLAGTSQRLPGQAPTAPPFEPPRA